MADTETFLAARGTFYRVILSPTNGAGMYKLQELRENSELDTLSKQQAEYDDAYNSLNDAFLGGGDTSGENESGEVVEIPFVEPERQIVPQDKIDDASAPVLILGVEISQSDIVSAIPCLNNVKVFHTFGQNFGTIGITGEVFLGALGNPVYGGFRRLTNFFWRYRVSQYKLPLAISVADTAYYFYLTGLKLGAIDTNFHTLSFGLVGILLDISREEAAFFNPKSLILTNGGLDNPSVIEALKQRRGITIQNAFEGLATTKKADKTNIAIGTDEIQGPAASHEARAVLAVVKENKPVKDIYDPTFYGPSNYVPKQATGPFDVKTFKGTPDVYTKEFYSKRKETERLALGGKPDGLNAASTKAAAKAVKRDEVKRAANSNAPEATSVNSLKHRDGPKRVGGSNTTVINKTPDL